mgnify:CR=1
MAAIAGIEILTTVARVATMVRQIASSMDGNWLLLWGLFQDRVTPMEE